MLWLDWLRSCRAESGEQRTGARIVEHLQFLVFLFLVVAVRLEYVVVVALVSSRFSGSKIEGTAAGKEEGIPFPRRTNQRA